MIISITPREGHPFSVTVRERPEHIHDGQHVLGDEIEYTLTEPSEIREIYEWSEAQ